MSTNSKVLVIWRIFHGLNPLSWILQDSNDLLEIVVIENSDVTIVVTNSYVTVKSGVANGSTLLMSWVFRDGGSSTSNFVCSIWVSVVVLFSGPDATRSKDSLLSDTNLVELVIISTCQESSGFLNDLKTPGFSITMSSVDKSLISSVHVDSNDSSIIVTKNNLVIENINC